MALDPDKRSLACRYPFHSSGLLSDQYLYFVAENIDFDERDDGTLDVADCDTIAIVAVV